MRHQLRNVRCPRCRKLLMRASNIDGAVLETRCHRCKATVIVNGQMVTLGVSDLTVHA